jgi:hypothetical protein
MDSQNVSNEQSETEEVSSLDRSKQERLVLAVTHRTEAGTPFSRLPLEWIACSCVTLITSFQQSNLTRSTTRTVQKQESTRRVLPSAGGSLTTDRAAPSPRQQRGCQGDVRGVLYRWCASLSDILPKCLYSSQYPPLWTKKYRNTMLKNEK